MENHKRLASLYGTTLEEIGARVSFKKPYTLKQLGNWLYQHGACSLEEMANIARSELDLLRDAYALPVLKIRAEKQSGKSKTKKFLLETQDGYKLESVLIDNPHGDYTLCMSSQIGCVYECAFCATGEMPFGRNLSAGEIVEQYVLLNKKADHKIKNLVYMGMGEPFANTAQVFKSIDRLTQQDGFGLSASRISVSTIGLLSGIESFSDYPPKVNLLVSLHSARQALRDKLMPNMTGQPLDALKKTIRSYQAKKNQKITLEYIMLKGLNDQTEDLKALIEFCQGLDVKVNLMAYNKNRFATYEPTDPNQILAFKQRLKQKSIPVVQRYKKGDDIAAACGQLAVGVKA